MNLLERLTSGLAARPPGTGLTPVAHNAVYTYLQEKTAQPGRNRLELAR